MKSEPAHLRWRIRAFLLGAVLGLAGIYLDESWLLVAALVALGGGVLLRVLRPGPVEEDD